MRNTKIIISLVFILCFFVQSFGRYETSISGQGVLVAPNVVLTSVGVQPGFVTIQDHDYGVVRYLDHPRLSLRLLFLDYPVLTTPPVPIKRSSASAISRKYQVAVESNVGPLDFGEFYKFVTRQFGSVSRDGKSIFYNSVGALWGGMKYGAGVFSYVGNSPRNIDGLTGIVVPHDLTKYGLPGSRHVIYLNSEAASWIESQVGSTLLGLNLGVAMKGYQRTQLPIGSIPSYEKIALVDNSRSKPAEPAVLPDSGKNVLYIGTSKYYEHSIGSFGVLIAPQVILTSAGIGPHSVNIQGHEYGVFGYKTHSLLNLKLLFLDYPVLTTQSVPIAGIDPMKMGAKNFFTVEPFVKISRSISLGKGYQFVDRSMNAVSLGGSALLINSDRRDTALWPKMGYGSGVFQYKGAKIPESIVGLAGIVTNVNASAYKRTGGRHVVMLNSYAKSWIYSELARMILGHFSFSPMGGYRKTQFPIKKPPVYTRVSVVVPQKPAPPKPKPIVTPKPQPSSVPIYIPNAGRFTQSTLESIERSIASTIEQKAFVIGGNFGNALNRIRKYRGLYGNVKTDAAFHNEMYKVLKKEFGYSHFYTMGSIIGRGSKQTPLPFPPYLFEGRGISGQTPELKWLSIDSRRIPHLIVPSFMNGQYNSSYIRNAISQMSKSSWAILDLRGNLGGHVFNARDLISYFINPNVTYGYLIDKPRYMQYVNSNQDRSLNFSAITKYVGSRNRGIWSNTTSLRKSVRFSGRLILLIDRNTGSSGEITSYALKRFANAIVIGENTAGAMLGADFVQLSRGITMCVPVFDYVHAGFQRIEGVGISPSAGFAVPSPSALSKAIDYIKTH